MSHVSCRIVYPHYKGKLPGTEMELVVSGVNRTLKSHGRDDPASGQPSLTNWNPDKRMMDPEGSAIFNKLGSFNHEAYPLAPDLLWYAWLDTMVRCTRKIAIMGHIIPLIALKKPSRAFGRLNSRIMARKGWVFCVYD